MTGRILVVCALLVGVARADDASIVFQTHGIEIAVPRDWAKIDGKDGATILKPKDFNGRGIEVATLKAMPQSGAELYKLAEPDLAGAKLVLTHDRLVERDGVKILLAEGKLTIKGIALDIDVAVLPVGTGSTAVLSFIKGEQDPTLRKLNDQILLSARVAGAKLSVTYTKPQASDVVGAPREFVDAMQKIATGLDQIIALPRPLPIRFEQCDTVNAFYSPKTHSITMCHELFDYLDGLFGKAGFSKAQVKLFVAGTALFTFFHEFGHALAGELELPITGKGEDAADEVATIFLSAAGDNGQAAALAAAVWFKTETKQPGHKNVFYDEHSFDEQRMITITCLLYGADPKRYGEMMKHIGVPDSRLARCAREYGERTKAWNTLLEPHRRAPVKK